MNLLVVTATVMELRAALSWGYDLRGLTEGRPLALEGGRPVHALVTGVGPLNAAYALGRTLGRESYAGVLNLGVAGSFDLDTLPLGVVATACSETWPEWGLARGDDVDPGGLPFPQLRKVNGEVRERIELSPAAATAAMNLRLSDDWPRVDALSVAGVSGTPARAARMAERFLDDQVGLESMEGFALALCCLRENVPLLEVRSISNRVGVRPPDGWDMPGALDALGGAARTLLGPGSGQVENP